MPPLPALPLFFSAPSTTVAVVPEEESRSTSSESSDESAASFLTSIFNGVVLWTFFNMSEEILLCLEMSSFLLLVFEFEESTSSNKVLRYVRNHLRGMRSKRAINVGSKTDLSKAT